MTTHTSKAADDVRVGDVVLSRRGLPMLVTDLQRTGEVAPYRRGIGGAPVEPDGIGIHVQVWAVPLGPHETRTPRSLGTFPAAHAFEVVVPERVR